MTAFNLTREPWISVEQLDGRVTELSTREVLRQAHTLRAIADPSPLVIGALTRHLLAVLHRSYEGPGNMRAWKAIASAHMFDETRTNCYLNSVEDRMDLFHPTHPFGQTPRLHERFRGYATPIDELEVVRSRWGGARELFRHRPEHPAPHMAPGRAARALLAHHAFATGGLVKKPGEPTSATAAPLARSALVIVRGSTLFRTLAANLLVYDGLLNPIPTGGAEDACSWEQAPPPAQLSRRDEPKRTPRGYLDLLTWLSRRTALVHENGAVTHFINCVGQGLAEGSPHDPMVAYRRHEKFGWLPITIDFERAFWRDAGALFETARGDAASYQRPRAIDLVASLDAREAFGGETLYDIEVLGTAAEKSRVDAVRCERVQSRGRSFDDPDTGESVRESLTLSTELVKLLDGALKEYARVALAPNGREPDPRTVRALVEATGAGPAAWSALGVDFEQLLRDVTDHPHAAARAFGERALASVRSVFGGATARADQAGRWLQAQAAAERSFQNNVARLSKKASEPSASGATV